MGLRDQTRLIPRNNWDYGFSALFGALPGIFNHAAEAPNVKKLFQQNPIWTNSGRASLYAILKSLELPAGARVGVPLFCCPVVFNAIRQAGLSPRFLDSNLSDCNISVDDLRKKRAELAAVVAVHMFGNPFDADAINATAGDMPVIEDCAQSVFSTYKGKQTGMLATASFFSFRCGKYISAGEGSAIFCKDPELQKKTARIVDSFESPSVPGMLIHSFLTFVKATFYNRPWYGLFGYPIGMRLDKKLNLTAKDGFETGNIETTYLAILNARIAHFEEKIRIQTEHARMLRAALAPGDYSLLSEGDGCTGNWFQFALRFRDTARRDALADHLWSRGIDTSKYLDNVADEARAQYGYGGDCPNAELLSKTVLLVPIHYTLRARDIQHIARSINEGSQIFRDSMAPVSLAPAQRADGL